MTASASYTQTMRHHGHDPQDGAFSPFGSGVDQTANWPDSTTPVTTAASPGSTTPLETGPDGNPLSWVGTGNTASGSTVVTWALAAWNYTDDSGRIQFAHAVQGSYASLVSEAFSIWGAAANITFEQVPDNQTVSSQRPDLRIGFADLHPASTSLIGETSYAYTSNGKFLPDTLIALEDPGEMAVTPLSNGDFMYNNTNVDMLQVLLHEIGHALGLAHNQTDMSSIMYPDSSASNRLPDANDIAGLQSVYGGPKPPQATASASDTILHLG